MYSKETELEPWSFFFEEIMFLGDNEAYRLSPWVLASFLATTYYVFWGKLLNLSDYISLLLKWSNSSA